jgi:antitoxin component YwqK of YwqJK toxin-antitoxin module
MKTNRRIGTTIFIGLLFLILASPSSALELLTKTEYTTNYYGRQLFLQYTYYLDVAGQEVLHGARTQYYLQTSMYTINQVSVIERYSHGKKHGLEEAWYQGDYSNTIEKHWEREYQDGQLHGVSREYYQDGILASYTTYRYGKLHGPARGYSNANLYDPLTLEANYQDGLLHGHCKRWVVQYVTGHWTRYSLEEGDYAYGKKQGLWKTWCTSDSDPSNRMNQNDQGNYSSDVKCGTWAKFYCYNSIPPPVYTNTNVACQAALPPGTGPPLPPGGNKYEIRGHVTDRNTNLPLAGVNVQAGPASGVSDAEGLYTVVLDSGGTLTLNAVKSGYYTFSRTVNLIESQYLDVAIAMKPEEAGGKPVITNVDPRGGTLFIKGIENISAPNENEYVVSVNWNGGQPGIVKFEVNGTPYEVTGTPSGASKTFDMNADFEGSLSPVGNTINLAGIESRQEILNPIVIPLPSWSLKFGEKFEIKQDGKHRVYKLDTKWPEKPLEILISESYLGPTLWTLWGFVPFVGGKDFGIPPSQAFLTVEAKTDGTGSIAAGGMSGFGAADGKIEIKLGGKGNLKYEPNVGLEWKETSLILGIKGTVEDTAGPITVIPWLEGAVNLPVIGRAIDWINRKAQFKATITANADTTLEVMSATGEGSRRRSREAIRSRSIGRSRPTQTTSSS